MDTVLLLSIFLVFITALLGAFIQRRKRDRVLADLQDFHTTAKLLDGTLEENEYQRIGRRRQRL